MISARPDLAAMPAPVHGGRLALSASGTVVRHDFSVCLNAFGPPDVVRRAITNAPIEEYPDPSSHEARGAAAAAWHLPVDEIAFGAGAAELIQAACLAFLRRGDDVLVETPSFNEYARSAVLCGARVTSCAGGVDALVASIATVRPRLVFVCSPSSPRGTVHGRDTLAGIADVCATAGALLVLDQAYDAFAEAPLGTPALRSHPAVLHLRSLTKEYAIAGVRVAFATGPADVIRALEAARVTWSASSLAQAAAIACFSADAAAHTAKTIASLRAEAHRIHDVCAELGYEPTSSATHFFLLRVANASAARATLLSRAGILVRDCTSFGLSGQIRIAARTPAANAALIDALRSLAPLLRHV